MRKRIPENREVDKSLNERVRARDKFTCRLCNKKKRPGSLEIHHIFKWANAPGLRFDEDNLICLCKKCHKSINRKEEFYASYFLEIIKNEKRRNK